MEWQIIVALGVTVPIMLLPVVLVWGLNAGGVVAALKKRRHSGAEEFKA